METITIILLTILSTLGVVAIITVVAVAIYRLGRKINQLEEALYRVVNQEAGELRKRIQDMENGTVMNFDDIRRELDSRCDKLDNKIKTSAEKAIESQKKVLQG